MIIATDIQLLLQGQEIVKKVSCTLIPDSITAFIGKSGAGKTTVLKALAGLLKVSNNGSVTINGHEIQTLSASQRSEMVGYVFQDFNLFAHMTVVANCMDPLLVHGMAKEEALKRALAQLQQLGMEVYANKYPSELSGGQKQRVAIARALCLNPTVLLLDEPTASLDPVNTAILVTILKNLATQGLTIGVSSQDMSFVRALFDRVYYMESGMITEFCEGLDQMGNSSEIRDFLAR